MSASAEEKFWSRVAKGKSAASCWVWQGSTRTGYGSFYSHGRVYPAHRFAYEAVKEPIPAGLVLDHLCRNRACVNPDHLEPVTEQVNILRGIGMTAMNARKTHCVNGHPLTGENIYTGRGRECRVCKRDWKRGYDARLRALRVGGAALEGDDKGGE
jgi:hypothetical protein